MRLLREPFLFVRMTVTVSALPHSNRATPLPREERFSPLAGFPTFLGQAAGISVELATRF